MNDIVFIYCITFIENAQERISSFVKKKFLLYFSEINRYFKICRSLCPKMMIY